MAASLLGNRGGRGVPFVGCAVAEHLVLTIYREHARREPACTRAVGQTRGMTAPEQITEALAYHAEGPMCTVPGAATLYRISPDGGVEVVLPTVTISNGIDFTPDGFRAYYNDTETGGTDILDVVDHRRPPGVYTTPATAAARTACASTRPETSGSH